MSKENKVKLKKVRALPAKQMDFYRRIQKSPERIKAKRRRRILAAGISFVILLSAAAAGRLHVRQKQLLEEVDALEAYVSDEAIRSDVRLAENKLKDALADKEKLRDYDNVLKNLQSYPVVTSDIFYMLEDSERIDVRITGYHASTGELAFEAVASEVTDVSEVIEEWKKLEIFQNVYFNGYAMSSEQEGYVVKVVCELSEQAGKQREAGHED